MVNWKVKDFVKTYSAAGGVMVAFLTAIALTWVGNRQFDELDEATYVQNRAYVHPTIPDTTVLSGELVAKIEFINYGKTPAYDFEMGLRFERWGNMVKELPKLRENPKQFPYALSETRTVIAPGERSPEVIRRDTNPWVEGGYLYVYGKIWYADFRGRHHFTSFGYVYEYFRHGFTRMPEAFAAD